MLTDATFFRHKAALLFHNRLPIDFRIMRPWWTDGSRKEVFTKICVFLSF